MIISQHRYFLLNKPYNMVSQFVSSHPVNLLCNLPFIFPEGIHAVGRLDHHSEGLLILTTNKKVTRLLFQGKLPHDRTYHVLVNNTVTELQLLQLQSGVQFKIKNDELYTTKPCTVKIIDHPPFNYPSNYIASDRVPHTWLSITLTEGKFHQVRKMLAAVQLKCKRLVRTNIENLTLGDLLPSEVKEIPEEEFFAALNIHEY